MVKNLFFSRVINSSLPRNPQKILKLNRVPVVQAYKRPLPLLRHLVTCLCGCLSFLIHSNLAMLSDLVSINVTSASDETFLSRMTINLVKDFSGKRTVKICQI